MTRAKDISKIVSDANFGGTLDVVGVLTGTSLDISGDIDIDGVTNLDVVDIDGAVDMASTLTVALDLNVGGAVKGNAGTRVISVGTAGSVTGGLQIWSATNQTSYIQFGDESGTASNHYRGFMAYSHTDDSLKFATGSTEQVRIHSNGVLSAADGVALGVGTANTASNVLDDYEEGTWTPILTNETTAVYSIQSGWYRKIGNTVYIYFSVLLSSKGDISGAYTRIGSLPFTGSPTTRFGSGQIHGYRLGSSAHIQGIEFGGSVGTLGWITTGGGTTSGLLNTSFVADNTYFEGFGIYRTA